MNPTNLEELIFDSELLESISDIERKSDNEYVINILGHKLVYKRSSTGWHIKVEVYFDRSLFICHDFDTYKIEYRNLIREFWINMRHIEENFFPDKRANASRVLKSVLDKVLGSYEGTATENLEM